MPCAIGGKVGGKDDDVAAVHAEACERGARGGGEVKGHRGRPRGPAAAPHHRTIAQGHLRGTHREGGGHPFQQVLDRGVRREGKVAHEWTPPWEDADGELEAAARDFGLRGVIPPPGQGQGQGVKPRLDPGQPRGTRLERTRTGAAVVVGVAVVAVVAAAAAAAAAAAL
jgi:hypothetical protein